MIMNVHPVDLLSGDMIIGYPSPLGTVYNGIVLGTRKRPPCSVEIYTLWSNDHRVWIRPIELICEKLKVIRSENISID